MDDAKFQATLEAGAEYIKFGMKDTVQELTKKLLKKKGQLDQKKDQLERLRAQAKAIASDSVQPPAAHTDDFMATVEFKRLLVWFIPSDNLQTMRLVSHAWLTATEGY